MNTPVPFLDLPPRAAMDDAAGSLVTTNEIPDFRSLIKVWPGGIEAFAVAAGCTLANAKTMSGRNWIPPSYWPALVSKAEEHGVHGLTLDLLTALKKAAAKPNAEARS